MICHDYNISIFCHQVDFLAIDRYPKIIAKNKAKHRNIRRYLSIVRLEARSLTGAGEAVAGVAPLAVTAVVLALTLSTHSVDVTHRLARRPTGVLGQRAVHPVTHEPPQTVTRERTLKVTTQRVHVAVRDPHPTFVDVYNTHVQRRYCVVGIV